MIGTKVYIPELELTGEVYEMHAKIKNLITKVKVILEDGKIDIIEVQDLAVIAIDTVGYFIKTKIFSKIKKFFQKIFKKKQ